MLHDSPDARNCVMSDGTRVLLSGAAVESFDAYTSQEGGLALEKALTMASAEIIAHTDRLSA